MAKAFGRGGITVSVMVAGLAMASTARDAVYRLSPINQINFGSVERAVTGNLSKTGVSFEEDRINQNIGLVHENGSLRYTITGSHKAFLSPLDCVQVEFEPFYYGSSGRVNICERSDGIIRVVQGSARPEDVNIERAAQYARLRR